MRGRRAPVHASWLDRGEWPNNPLERSMSNSLFSVDDGVLRISGRAINTGLPVRKAIQVGGKIIALLEITGREEQMNENVLCFDSAGDLIWRIDPSMENGPEMFPYVYINVCDGGAVVAYNWIGMDYSVDLDDGTVKAMANRRF